MKSDKLISEHDYLFGRKREEESKIIDVMSKQDFPTLSLGGETGPLWSEQ